MKKNKLNMVVAIALCVSLGLSSCIGSFKLTNKVLGWNVPDQRPESCFCR